MDELLPGIDLEMLFEIGAGFRKVRVENFQEIEREFAGVHVGLEIDSVCGRHGVDPCECGIGGGRERMRGGFGRFVFAVIGYDCQYVVGFRLEAADQEGRLLWLFDDGHFGCSVGDIDLVGDPDRIVEFQGEADRTVGRSDLFDRNDGGAGRKGFGFECVGDGIGGLPVFVICDGGDLIVGRRLQVVGCIGAAFGAVYERKFGRSVGNIDLVAEAGCIGGFQGKGYRIIGGFHLFDGDGCLVGIRRGRFFGGRECCGGRIRRALVGVIGDRRQLIRGFGGQVGYFDRFFFGAFYRNEIGVISPPPSISIL